MPEVRVIQPTIQQAKKLRVCAYARVSSDSDDQLNSFAAQVGYYTQYIKSNGEWEFADIYADEGITGTSADKRDEFQRLMRDCRAGKIDRVLVKSVSRFARNIADCISAVRELKQLGVAVEFEKEGIDTSAMGSEMLLSMLSAVAQEESLSISQNARWSYQKRMRKGEFISTKAPFGYTLENNSLVPNPQEIPVVQFIFDRYLKGMSLTELVRELNRQQVSPGDGDSAWNRGHVRYILKNEKYIGDARVQKSYTTESLPRQKKINNGEVPQYYIQNSHAAIIDREVFERVQALLQKKAKRYQPKNPSQTTALNRRIQCGVCGKTFRRKGSDNQQNKVMWVCMTHFEDKEECPVKAISEAEIHRAFFLLYHKLLRNRHEILETMLSQLQELHSKEIYQQPEAAQIHQEIAKLMKQNHALARLQTKGYIDSALFIEQTTEINGQIAELRAAMKQYQATNQTSEIIENTKVLIALLEDGQPIQEFDGAIFSGMVQKVIVDAERITFQLINGLQLVEGRCNDR